MALGGWVCPGVCAYTCVNAGEEEKQTPNGEENLGGTARRRCPPLEKENQQISLV